jgi:hypothetical protein
MVRVKAVRLVGSLLRVEEELHHHPQHVTPRETFLRLTESKHHHKILASNCQQRYITFRSINTLVGLEVFTPVVIKSSVWWDIKPCSPLEINRRFGGACHLRLQVIRIKQVRNQHKAGSNQAWLIHRPWRWRLTQRPLTFNGPHDVTSQYRFIQIFFPQIYSSNNISYMERIM